MKRATAIVTALVVLLGCAAVGVTAAPPAAAAYPDVYYANHNVAGAKSNNNGLAQAGGSLQYLAAVMMAHIYYGLGASAVSLEELCDGTQISYLESNFVPLGYLMAYTPAKVVNLNGNCAHEGVGVMTLGDTNEQFALPHVYTQLTRSPNDISDGNSRRALCVRRPIGATRHTACGSHLSSNRAYAAYQVPEFDSYEENWRTLYFGLSHFAGCDCNLSYPYTNTNYNPVPAPTANEALQMQRFYAGRREANGVSIAYPTYETYKSDPGQQLNVKIDFVFVESSLYTANSLSIWNDTTNYSSDHVLVWGGFTHV